MTKHAHRWPIWKIAVATACCVIAAGGLFWISRIMEQPPVPSETEAPARTAAFSLPTFLLMMAMVAGVLGLGGFGWLVVRVREARTPPWKRRKKGRHH